MKKSDVAGKYRLGNGWVVYYFDEVMGIYRNTNPMNYYEACKWVREVRENWSNTQKLRKHLEK